jgi:uncharacterized RDD family membrane protein YckC
MSNGDIQGETAAAGQLASLDLRWLAAGVDAALQTAGVVVGASLGLVVVTALDLEGPVAIGTVMTLVAAMALLPTAVSWYLIARDGQSLGKRWVDIRIVDASGRPPGFWAGVVLRIWAIAVVAQFIPPLPLMDVGFILVKGRRALHDHLAGTRVVSGRPDAASAPATGAAAR